MKSLTRGYKLTTRFAKFCNVPELTNILSSIADFHEVEKDYSDLPEFEGYTDSLSEGSDDFKDYLKDISNRADDIRNKQRLELLTAFDKSVAALLRMGMTRKELSERIQKEGI